MNFRALSIIFQKIRSLRVGVIGDFAVDFYIETEPNTGEISVETAKEVHWGRQPKTSLGGAGNVVQNLTALGVPHIEVFGYTGQDIFGREMRHLLTLTNSILTGLQTTDYDTPTYTKPITHDEEEQNRLDFGTQNKLSDTVFAQIMAALEQSIQNIDVLIINQQFKNPLLTPGRIEQLNKLIINNPSTLFVADLRDFGHLIKGAILKVNTDELARMLGISVIEPTMDWCIKNGQRLGMQLESPILITRGEKGLLYVEKDAVTDIEAVLLEGPIDPVGAGDTVVATFAAVKAVGTSTSDALKIANLAAAVTVQKLKQTGAASAEEIIALQKKYYP